MARVVQMGGALTVMLLGGFMLVMFRRDYHNDGNGGSNGTTATGDSGHRQKGERITE